MIKFEGKTEAGRKLIGFGLTEMNLIRLKSGHPIHVHCDELGFVGELVIFYGETEEKLAAELRSVMQPGQYIDRRKDKKN